MPKHPHWREVMNSRPIASMWVRRAILSLGATVALVATMVPGVVTAQDVAPTWVTGTAQHVESSCSEIGSTPGSSTVTHTAYRCTQTWTSSDPRLSGSAVRAWAEDTHQTAEGVVSVGTSARYLSNEGGGWACVAGYLGTGATPDLAALADDTFTCIGSGGYEGLSAIIVTTLHADDFGDDFVGLIFPGDVPSAPEAPAAQ
jgi:hypothetical protein